MSATYIVKLNVFEGPLDLLLHLISKAKVDIKDISISDITEQYLEYLNKMKRFDIEIASEFLVMASTLIYIKSRTLVPEVRNTTDEEDDHDNIDSQEKLIQKLIEYKKYKEVGQKLRVRGESYSNIYYKAAEEITLDEIDGTLLYGLTKDDLLGALQRVILAKNEKDQDTTQEHIIRRNTFTLEERTKELNNLLATNKKLTFFNLFDEDYKKIDVIITFLALLELIRKGQVKLYQEKPFKDIIIRKRG